MTFVTGIGAPMMSTHWSAAAILQRSLGPLRTENVSVFFLLPYLSPPMYCFGTATGRRGVIPINFAPFPSGGAVGCDHDTPLECRPS